MWYTYVYIIIPNLFLRAGFFVGHVQSVFCFDYQAISFDRKLAEVLDLRAFKLNSARVRFVVTTGNRKACTLMSRRLHPQIVSRHYVT